MKVSKLSVAKCLSIVMVSLFMVTFFQSSSFAQTLTISSSGETGTSGTNWTSSGSNLVKISFTGTASINPSVIEGLLTSGKDVIIEAGTGGSGITVSNNISAPSSTQRLIFNSPGTITLGANITTAGPQIYNGIVSVSGARSAIAGKLWFNGTITGDDNITLNASAGDLVIMGDVQTSGVFSVTASGASSSFVMGVDLISGVGSTISADGGVTIIADTSFLAGAVTTSNTAINITGNIRVAHFATTAAPMLFNSGNGQITLAGTNNEITDFTGTSLEYALLTANKAKDVIGSSVDISSITIDATGSLVYSYDTAGDDIFFAPYQITSADYLVVGGGGGGGGSYPGQYAGGGGGGGGVANGTLTLPQGSGVDLSVGAGGSLGTNSSAANTPVPGDGTDGSDSRLGSVLVGGGGAGGGSGNGSNVGRIGKNGIGGAGYTAGGGGGGAGGAGNANFTTTGGTGSQRNGGTGSRDATETNVGGAGGGAVGNGVAGGSPGVGGWGGTGGSGFKSSITGAEVEYGKGAGSYGTNNTKPGSGSVSNGYARNPNVDLPGADGIVIIRHAVGNTTNHIATAGLSVGHSSNTGNVTINNATTIDGPLSVYGGFVNVNENLNTASGNANGDILIKATGDISLAASKSITTNGGDVVFWSDSDASGTTTSAGGTIALLASSSIATSGGNIVLAGGTDTDTDGIPDGYTIGGASTTAHGATNARAGLYLDGANLDAGTGDVLLKGQGTGNSQNFQIGTRLYGGTIKGADVRIEGKGSILGPSSSSWGLSLEGFSIEGSGDISLLGWGGRAGSSNTDVNQAGVEIRAALDNASKHSQIKATGSGTISIDGVGGSGTFSNFTATDYETAASAGIRIQASQTNPILSANGNITLNGTSGYSGRGVGMVIASPISSTNGNISLKGNASTTGTLGLNGNVIVNGKVSTSGDVYIESPGTVSQTAEIISSGLGLAGTGNFTLNNTSNNFLTLAGGDNTTKLGSLSLTDASDGLTIGRVDGKTGVTATSTISIETLSGNISLTQNISTDNTTADAVIINAGKTTAIGTATGGDIIVSGTPAITTGSGGIAKLFSGSDNTSTGLTNLAGGTSNTRFEVDETTSTFSPVLVSGNVYALYRTTTTIADLTTLGCITLVASGGDAENSTWTYSGGVIMPKSATAVNLNASDIVAKMALGNLTVAASCININDDVNYSANANGITFKASGNVIMAAAKSIITKGGNVTFHADADANRVGGIRIGSDNAGLFTTEIATNGGDIILSGGTDLLTGFASYDAGLGAAASEYNYGIGIFGAKLEASGTSGSGGNIIIRGNSGNTFNGLLWTVNIGGQYGANTTVKTNGTGSISIVGDMSEAPANPTPRNSRNAWAVNIPATIETESGSINLTGKTNVARTNARGFSISGAVQSSTGTITVIDETQNTTSANYSGPYINGAKFGKGSLPSSSSEIILISDEFAFDNNASVNTTGNVTLKPNDDSFSGALSVANIDLVGSGLTVGKPTNNQNITISKDQIIDGPVTIYGNNLSINAKLEASSNKINLYASGAATQTAAIKANGLGLHGSGTFTLNNIANAIDTIAGGDNKIPLGSLSFTNSTKLTVGIVNPTGITSTGAISVATVKGDLLVKEPIISTLSIGDAVKLYAEKDTAAGKPGLGNIKISNNGAVTIESGARALMYSGVDSLSTGVSTLAGTSNVRKQVDATTNLATLSKPVSSTGTYALYRYTEYVNSAPTNISLTPTSVNENAAIGTTVGTLSATDADVNDTFTFTLVSGAGDTNNSSFTISGTTLKTSAVFDYETKKSYTIRVKVTDGGDSSFSKQFTVTINDLDNEDTDGDGFLDSEEKGSDPANPRDTDGDGTPDFKDTDSDDDGVPDSVEKTDGTDHLDESKYKDSDGDLVPDHVETQDSTDKNDSMNYKDTDGDGVPDYIEKIDGTNPNDATKFKDTDGGGVPDYVETTLYPANGLPATDPSKQSDDKQDTDGDGVSDYEEIKDGTDPNDEDKFKDTDGDGVPDAVERTDGTDPDDAGKYKDSDGDHVPDYVEGNEGTDTNDVKKFKDSDGDGVPDYIEKIDGTNPNDATKFKDIDGGGVPDYVETILLTSYGLDATDPSKQSDDNQDTDGDGTSDYQEIKNGTNPNDAPSNLNYSPSSLNSEQGKPITTMTPSSEAGRVLSYRISPSLPASLVFDTTTGKITGTRTAAMTGSVEYTITARNRGGSTTSTITISYNTAPTNISLSKSNIYEKNRIGDVIGQLSSTDIDSPESHTYTLVMDGGDSLDNKFFSINGNQLLAGEVYTYTNRSTYTINVLSTDSKGLTTEKKFTITISELPEIYGSFSGAYTNVSVPGSNTRSKTPIISRGYNSQLEIVGSNIRSASWSPATGLSSSTSLNPVFNHPTTVNYVVTITNTNGSTTQIPFTVEVRDDYTIKPSNIMSTRQDGINDYFVVENIQTYSDNEVTIFDASGRTLIKMSNYNNRWDGKINGKFLATGTYYYLIRFTSRPAIVHRGFITIINN